MEKFCPVGPYKNDIKLHLCEITKVNTYSVDARAERRFDLEFYPLGTLYLNRKGLLINGIIFDSLSPNFINNEGQIVIRGLSVTEFNLQDIIWESQLRVYVIVEK